MKKLLLLLVFILGLSSCSFNGYYENKWYSNEELEKCNVPNLPKIDTDLYYMDYFSRICFSMEYLDFENYAKEVYSYLESLNFTYFGTQGEQKDTLAGAFTSYYYKAANSFDECKNHYNGQYFVFVYSDGSLDENNSIIFNEIALYRGVYNISYKRNQYEFNSMIKINDVASYFIDE